MMRGSSQKTVFDKGYMPNWTKTHFKVSQAVLPKRGTKRSVYKLIDFSNEIVKGSWYPTKLQEISNNKYRIEKC